MRSPWFVGDFPITQGYKPGPGTYDPGHTGIDVGVPEGTPLITPVAATVTDRENPGGFGHYQTVVPDASPGDTFILGHESKWDVSSGHEPAGTQVGESGHTGRATGPHVHFEQDRGGPPYAAGNEVNPMVALTGGLPYEQQQGTAASGQVTANSMASGSDPFGITTWLSNILSRDNLWRFGLIVGGAIIVLIGLVVLTKSYERAPAIVADAARGAASLTPEGAVASAVA